MSSISISVDGAARSVESDQKPTQIFADNKEIVVCKVNGQLKDLWTDLKDGDVVEGVSISSPEGLAVLRHSTAHVMAQAVQQTFSQTRLGIGPPITDGFYYDFDPQQVSITTLIRNNLLLLKIWRKLRAQCARLLRTVSDLSAVLPMKPMPLKNLRTNRINVNLLESKVAEMKRPALKSAALS